MSNKEKEDQIAHPSCPKQTKNVDDHDLERLAVEALLEDARQRKLRVERVGTMGWVKQRQVNKRFLNSVVLQTVSRHATNKVHVRGGSRGSDKEMISESSRSTGGSRRPHSRDRDVRLRESERDFQRRGRDRDSSCDRERRSKKQRLTEEKTQTSISLRDKRVLTHSTSGRTSRDGCVRARHSSHNISNALTKTHRSDRDI